ncbi:MAG: MBL fold metallo-hydrolase [Promethearchaeota archaeon]
MNDFFEALSDENIFFIRGERDGRYPYSHSIMIGDYLIDTGISSKHLRKLKRNFSINNVILSHWHEDHISGNRLLPNSKYFCHDKDKPIIEDIEKFNFYYYIEDYPEQVELFEPLIEGLRLQNTKIEKTLDDGEIIEIGDNLKLEILHTPGHSAGHLCFYEINSKIAFLSDIDLSSFGPWYAGRDSSVIDFENSINKIMKYDIEIAATSHKGVITGRSNVKQKLNHYKSIIHERDEKILSFLSEKKPITIETLLKKNLIYGYYTEFEVYEIFAEKIMLKLHFDKFLKNKLIEKKNTGYILS